MNHPTPTWFSIRRRLLIVHDPLRTGDSPGVMPVTTAAG
jgi:hypothetical protein